ncbi:PadR family transcriptional regulator, partial [archaeon]|nr:PadR family transcriptional regulator [archaeon]
DVSQFHQFPLIPGRKKCLNEGHITTLYSKLAELGGHFSSEGYKALRLAIDFGDLLGSANPEVFDCLEGHSQRCRENFLISQLYAVDINSVDQEILGRLVRLHDRMVISAGDGSMIYLPTSSLEEPTTPYINVTSCKTMEHCVKSSLDVIVLSLLQQEPMCGFDVIKTIVQRFNVRLSQGVVYPLLYSFKEQGYLRTEIKPDNKTKVYILTKGGGAFIRKHREAYATAQKRIFDLTASGIV